jgi:predicted house-cleaning noncanonical NTP pyrophosphatase (MazG superfamily)
MKNVLGKIFVFALFVMSLVLMTFAGAIFVSHTDWQKEIDRRPEECFAGQRPGYKFQLEEAEKDRDKLQQEITQLTQRVSASELARDQVVAKLQTAIVQKDQELQSLRADKDKRQAEMEKAVQDVRSLRDDLLAADKAVEQLQAQVKAQQEKVDSQVDKSSQLSASLAETQAQLTIAEERKAQLEKQVANARILLTQNGLTVDSLPKDRVPTLDGDVIAVAAGSIQVSLGSDDGLQVGHTLEVYRGGEYIGRAVVKTVMHDHAVAEIVKAYARGVVQRGDKVTTRLKA